MTARRIDDGSRADKLFADDELAVAEILQVLADALEAGPSEELAASIRALAACPAPSGTITDERARPL